MITGTVPWIPITDVTDPRLALYRGVADPALLTHHDAFIVEGRRIVRRLLASTRYELISILVNEAASRALGDVLAPAAGTVAIFLASDEIVGRLTGHHIHRGALALARRPPLLPFTEWLETPAHGQRAGRAPDPRPTRLVAAEALSNPDNVGGVFRNAAAFGATAVVIDPKTSDPLYRKAIRTSMGASLLLPWTRATPWPGALAACRARGFAILALTVDNAAPSLRRIAATLRTDPLVVLVGNEGEGLSGGALDSATHRARIPMAPGWDSLNAAVSTGVALYELTTG